MEKYLWLLAGLAVGAIFPNIVKPRLVAAWRWATSVFKRK